MTLESFSLGALILAEEVILGPECPRGSHVSGLVEKLRDAYRDRLWYC